MPGKLGVLWTVLLVGCGSIEGVYNGQGTQTFGFPSAALGGQSALTVTITKLSGDDVQVQFGTCALSGTSAGDTISIAGWSTGACRFATSDGRTLEPTVLVGTVSRSGDGISLTLQGTVADVQNSESLASYSMMFTGAPAR